jgi:hypothetical protein
MQTSGYNRMKPDFYQISLLAGAVALPGEFGARLRLRAGGVRCRCVVRRAVWVVLVFGRWQSREDGCGLPVTPSARGMRARKFSLVRGPDLRVLPVAVEQAGRDRRLLRPRRHHHDRTWHDPPVMDPLPMGQPPGETTLIDYLSARPLSLPFNLLCLGF